MKRIHRNRKGFSLVELLVAIIIVSILVSVSIPIVSQHKKRAILTEAISAMGMIRTLQALYFVEHGYYYDPRACPGDDITGLPGIKGRSGGVYGTGDLDGTFFSQECYWVWRSGGPDTYYVECMIRGNTVMDKPNRAPRKDEVIGWRSTGFGDPRICMDMDGRISWTNIEGLTYLIEPE